MTTSDIDQILKILEIHDARRPRPSHVNMVQAAEILGKNVKTVSKMVRFGSIKLNPCGMIPITEIDRVLAVSGEKRAA